MLGSLWHKCCSKILYMLSNINVKNSNTKILIVVTIWRGFILLFLRLALNSAVYLWRIMLNFWSSWLHLSHSVATIGVNHHSWHMHSWLIEPRASCMLGNPSSNKTAAPILLFLSYRPETEARNDELVGRCGLYPVSTYGCGFRDRI